MEQGVRSSVRSKRKAAAPAVSSTKRRRQQPPAHSSTAVSALSGAQKPRPKLKTHRSGTSESNLVSTRPNTYDSKPIKERKLKAVEQLTLFSRYSDPSVQSPLSRRIETSRVTDYNSTGATLLETPPSQRHREKPAPLTIHGGVEGAVDLMTTDVSRLETVEGDGILETLMRSTTPRVQRRFPSENALTDSEQRDREVLRRRRVKLRSQYSAMKEEHPKEVEIDADFKVPEVERALFQEEAAVLSSKKTQVDEKDEERVQLEEEAAETDEETTESKINRLGKIMHLNWRQFFFWLVAGALLLCGIVVATPFVRKLMEPPLPYCDSDWIEAKDGSFVLADPANHFDRSKALQPFISTSTAVQTSGAACQPCPVYGNCLNGSVISCAPPYVLQYGLCKENPEVQESLDHLAISIQQFVVQKAAKSVCADISLWNYVNADETEPGNGRTASVEVLLSDVQAFVMKTISFGKAAASLPREYVFSRAMDMALRDLKDIFVTEDQTQLVVDASVVPWSCRAKHQLYSYMKLIALAVALGTALVFGYRQFLLYRTERELVDRFMKEVRFFLLDRTRKSTRFYPADHLRDDLFEKQSVQDRAWLCKSVWPKVAAAVKEDSRITSRLIKYVLQYGSLLGEQWLLTFLFGRVRGEDLVVWEWASSSSPRRTGASRGRGLRVLPKLQGSSSKSGQTRQRKKSGRPGSRLDA
ncbi:hypothetical protein P3T76_007375 [Phytophthora citrophthora]|uniref:Man1/Src1-like C-terminal domain-containing protein n=1 Tax=Phytophthora citrophthora TaxID=4793 RepID=A0AAD9GN76_9STRA|nr:hypothetical protein P3T76_007375 [Phytophthora citrophthora]